MKRRAAKVPTATALRISTAIVMSSSGDALVMRRIGGSGIASRYGWPAAGAPRPTVAGPGPNTTCAAGATPACGRRSAGPPAPPAKPVITYDWYRTFIQFMIDNHWEGFFGKVIAFGETAVGVALILGAFIGIAAVGGAFMNLNFMLAGSASTNPVLLLLGFLLVLAWKTAGYIGLDRYLLPTLRTPWPAPRAAIKTGGAAVQTPQLA